MTFVCISVPRKDPNVIEVLLEHGADTTHLYNYGHTAVHLAVLKDQPVILRALARYGADMNVKVAGISPSLSFYSTHLNLLVQGCFCFVFFN